MEDGQIFTNRKRWLLRSRISSAEIISGLGVVLALAATVWWIAAQRDNFNPADRDLTFEVLAAHPVEDRLYQVPLKPWVEPGSVATGATSLDLGLFPASILSGGWAISSRPRSFDRKTLFEKINGEAEKFIRQGFRELQYIAIKNPATGDEIAIELFDQGGFTGGIGIFSDHRTEGREISRMAGAIYYATPVGAIGFRGRYFFRIAGNKESAAVTAKTGELIGAFAKLPQQDSSAPAPLLALTQGLKIRLEEIGYQRQNVFQYDFAGDFWFGRYSRGQPGRVFIHQAPSAAAAEGLFQDIGREHAFDHSVLNRTKRKVIMRHNFLKTHFIMAVSGDFLYGVENESDAARAKQVADRLSAYLRDET